MLPSVRSVAVTVKLPLVLNARGKVCVPATSGALEGKVAVESLAVIPIMSGIVLTTFQLASTALTVTLKLVKALWAPGVPVLPVALPGAAVSPGTSNCSLVNAPGFTVKDGLVLALTPTCVLSEPVTVALPAVFAVRLKVLLPLTRAALAGKVAFESLEVIVTVSLVLIRFQLASTALTVTVKAAPAVSVRGVPVLPVAVPGAAVSPGNNNCSFVNAPPLTWSDGVEDDWMDGAVTSDAVTVAVPTVRRVTVKVLVPEESVALAGKVALLSDELMATRSAAALTTFQLASTALTVTLNAVPAVRAVGAPVLPVAVPGTAVSPGASNCRFTNAPGFTVMAELVLAVLVPSVMSVAVTVRLPAVFMVTLKLPVPELSAAFDGSGALVSEHVIPTVCVTFVTGFQLASTALTIRLNAAPAA